MISVIIATYNREKTLMRAVNSILNQSYKDWELIIVDDASCDKTTNIIKNIIFENSNKKIKYYKMLKNKGVNFCRNFGIKQSSGELICFLDDDDKLFFNALDIINKKIIEYSQYNIWVFQYKKEGSDILVDMGYAFKKDEQIHEAEPKNIICRVDITGDMFYIYQRQVFDELLFPDFIRNSQFLFFGRLIKKFKMLYIKNVIGVCYDTFSSLSKITYKKQPREFIHAYKMYLKENNYIFKKYKDKKRHYTHSIAQCYLLLKKYPNFIWWYLKGFFVYPQKTIKIILNKLFFRKRKKQKHVCN